MRVLKVTFLLLVAVGICGGLYFGLYGGMRLAGLTLVKPDAPAAPAATSPGPRAAAAREEDPQEALKRRLNDLGPADAAPRAFADAPQPPPTAIVPAPFRTWLPAPVTGSQPRPLPGDQARPRRAGPAVDVPPVADAGMLLPPPTRVRLPAVLPMAVASPDPAHVALDSVAVRATASDRADLSEDPTAHEARRSVTAATPPLRQTPAPFLKLSIPDPSPLAGAAELKNPPPDEDPPVSAPGLPARVTLPEKKTP
jgi:hypothetical protein